MGLKVGGMASSLIVVCFGVLVFVEEIRFHARGVNKGGAGGSRSQSRMFEMDDR